MGPQIGLYCTYKCPGIQQCLATSMPAVDYKVRHYFLSTYCLCLNHDDVIKWKHFPRYWLFVRGIHRSSVNCPHKGQWHRALMFSLICTWINGWVNNGDAGDLIRHRAHCDVTVVLCFHFSNDINQNFLRDLTTLREFIDRFYKWHNDPAPALMSHCGMRDRCIVRYVRLLYSMRTFQTAHCMWCQHMARLMCPFVKIGCTVWHEMLWQNQRVVITQTLSSLVVITTISGATSGEETLSSLVPHYVVIMTQ